MSTDYSQLKKAYGGKIASGRLFSEESGYQFTLSGSESEQILCFSLPLLQPMQITALSELLTNPTVRCEYNSSLFCVTFDDEEETTQIIDKIIDFLTAEGVPSDICAYCGNEGADTKYTLDGNACLLHKGCADEMYKFNKNKAPERPSRRVAGFAIGAALGLIGGASYILFALLGVMPALGGIPIGLLAGLGFRIFNRSASSACKVIFFIIFLVLCAGCNLAADYFYSVQQNLPMDIIATYSDPLNLFNTVFDILGGAIIAMFSKNLALDFKAPEGYRLSRL